MCSLVTRNSQLMMEIYHGGECRSGTWYQGFLLLQLQPPHLKIDTENVRSLGEMQVFESVFRVPSLQCYNPMFFFLFLSIFALLCQERFCVATWPSFRFFQDEQQTDLCYWHSTNTLAPSSDAVRSSRGFSPVLLNGRGWGAGHLYSLTMNCQW